MKWLYRERLHHPVNFWRLVTANRGGGEQTEISSKGPVNPDLCGKFSMSFLIVSFWGMAKHVSIRAGQEQF